MTSPRPNRALALIGLLLALTSACLSGCATPNPNPDPEDPWERMNRGTFAFNEAADKWVIEPAAKGWDFVMPEIAQTGVANFFENLRMPRYVLNNLLQGRPADAVFELHRFALNTLLGLGGFIDVASHVDWPHYPEEFDLTMGHWGVPQGAYLMLPIFGASTVRGTGGLIADSMSQPISYFVPFYVPIAATATDMLNKRSIYLEEIAQIREESFDFYLSVRNAYMQNRKHRMSGGGGDGRSGPFGAGAAGADSTEEDLYYFDDEEEDEVVEEEE